MASQLAVINELMEIYKTYRPALEVATRRNEILKSLDAQQFEALQRELIARSKCGEETQLAIVEDVMSDLILYTNFSIDTLLKAQLDAGWTPLDYLFRAAGEQAEGELWARLESNPTLCLSALAWIDKLHILSKFAEWNNNPPDWQPQFSAETYSHQAGWELNSDNEKRWLFSKTCYGVKAKKTVETPPRLQSPFLNAPATKACRYCNLPTFAISNPPGKYLDDLFDIPLIASEVDIPFCIKCTNACAVHLTISSTGAVDFSPHDGINRQSNEPIFPLKTEGGILHVEVDSATRNPYSAVDSGRTYNLSQIGGFPTWPQSAQYPKCVECTKTMLFLTQVESMDFPILNYEGIYHIFVCEFCYGEFAVQQER